METVLIVIHLMIVVALVGVVLMQRSEGGGLGIGGGSGFMSARGAGNALTRTTAILATLFFLTSLGLSLLARYGGNPADILDQFPGNGTQQQQQGTPPAGGSILDQIGGAPAQQEAPVEQAPADTQGGVPTGAEPQAPTAPTESQAPAAPAEQGGQVPQN
ncbi:preprotein translocase subunit SecG [Limoniibacter endophyticus]|uniref:Protein-export membrane protein SecG n=1 Tax=Limoniibacter endophyticus TaxID=1565040 RepID=A0A8J3DFE4_9HYPH|nr:preprotein translocase subunit SecG [Limoniibacter endophyticus]GHC60938.1 preprotein translocase subunit SecG [Limoniibacter endophyticus]